MARLARRTWWVFAAGGLVAAFVVFILGMVLTLGNNDKYGKLPVPGEGSVHLPEGDVLVYYEERAGLPSDDSLNVPPLELRVRSVKTREPLKPESAGSRSTYQYNNLDGTSFARLHVPSDGDYGVVVRSPAQRPYPDPAITFGADADLGSILLRSLLIAGIGLGSAALLAIVAYSGRRPPTPVTPATTTPYAPPSPPPLKTENLKLETDPAAQLRTLKDQRGRGDLSQAEYEKRRAEIIDRL